MKTSYFIQTHKNPEQIYRLIRTIKKSTPDAQIIIGHDFTNTKLDITPLEKLSEIHLLPGKKKSIRGDFSLIRPYLNAINWLCNRNDDFDWLIYISGQDYLTQSPANIELLFKTTKYDGFIKYWDISERFPENNFRRYFYQYYRLPNSLQWLFKKIIKYRELIQKYTPLRFYPTYGSVIGIPAKSTPFNEKFICYRGYQWQTLSRKCVLYIKKFVDENPEFVRYFEKTIAPDESFIQTILVNSGLFNLCNDHKRYFKFSGRGGGHPLIITKDEYSQITNGDFHFARKFDPDVDSEILDMLDHSIFLS